MQVTNDVRQRVEQKLRESIKLAERHYGQQFEFPTIRYAKRGTTAGTASYNRWEVNFNAVLLMENIDKFIDRTVPHEMAHLIDYQLHPWNFDQGAKRKLHGPSWKAIMRVMGGPTTRCHDYDTTTSRVSNPTRVKYLYKCETCGRDMFLGPKRHLRMSSGITRYRMQGCAGHGGYTYVGSTGRPPVATITRRPPTFQGTSKLDQCRKLYRNLRGATRQVVLQQFISLVGCTPNGASTYYAKVKKEMG